MLPYWTEGLLGPENEGWCYMHPGDSGLVDVGGSKFGSCLFPLVIGNRYFHVGKRQGTDTFTVIVLQPDGPVVEVLENEPQHNPISDIAVSSAGVITVFDKATGRSFYKIRPGYEGSSVFARFRDREQEINISDREIRWGEGNVISGARIVGFEIGILFEEDGSFALGARLPDPMRNLLSR